MKDESSEKFVIKDQNEILLLLQSNEGAEFLLHLEEKY
jgi:hypothetical protein